MFSKRHRQIDQKTRELLTKEPEKADGNIAAIREHIAHKERDRKIRDMGLPRLQALWDIQMTPEQKSCLKTLANRQAVVPVRGEELAEQAVLWAEEHLFERNSVVNEHELWRQALQYARGQDVNFKDVLAMTRLRNYVRDEQHPGNVTTREHLLREWEIVEVAKEGQCAFHPFCWDYRNSNPALDAEQRQAVEAILTSTHFVLFRGGAGTGKSYTLREVERALKATGREVYVIAPQRQQVMDLEKDGFQNVETVSAFLARGELARRAVVLADEAGQIGGRQMHALLELIQANEGRVILSGDTRQHGALEATDALRAIERYSGVKPIELTTIRRQNPKLAKTIAERGRIREYRQAVAEARDGKLAESFDRLDKQAAITQCTLADQHEKLTKRYVEMRKDHQSTLVVAQTWNEIHSVNEQIRLALKREKLVGETDTTVTAFQPVNLTDAQKRDARSYDEKSRLIFNRDLRGFKAGESVRLQTITNTHLIVESSGRMAAILFKHLDRITVGQPMELSLSSGDRLQLKANGRSEDKRKLANGELVTIKEVHEDGRIALADGRVLPLRFRQFVRGYAVTSYASQGKTVDHVLFSDSAVKAATSQQQWYVTISRGRKGVEIFTTDKQQLREQITRSGDRPLAMGLTPKTRHSWFHQAIEQRYGPRAAYILSKKRQGRIHLKNLQRVRQVPSSAVRQSRGRGIGM